MKTICRFTGVPIWKSNLLMGYELADEHPIFQVKKSQILHKDMIHRFAEATNVDEKKLIYCAVLNASHLVSFEVPAMPSLSLMEKTFYQMIPLVEWVLFAEHRYAKVVSFPQYVIRKDNEDLQSIKGWLTSLEEIRTKINLKDLDRDKNASLLQRENEFKRELGEANFFNKAFTPKLAKWALEVCDITIRHKDYQKWMKIMCLPLSEAWIVEFSDLHELQDILQSGLPNLEMNPQAISVMHQMRNLVAQAKKGFTEFSIFDDKPIGDTEFEIVEDDLSDLDNPKKVIHKINQHLVDVPTSEPNVKDFPKRIDFLMAKAKWDLSKAKAEKMIGEDEV